MKIHAMQDISDRFRTQCAHLPIEKVCITQNCKLTENEVKVFNIATYYINLEISESPLPAIINQIIVLFLCNDHITFSLDDPFVLGTHMEVCILPLFLWRKYNLDLRASMFTTIEELCHGLWKIPDGEPIQKRVESILKRIDPTLAYANMYNHIRQLVLNRSKFTT